jgi:Domain of unknown function (DUF4352)
VIKVRCGVPRVGGAYLNEKSQGQFCLVSLRVKNVGDDPTHYSEENQTLIDSKGKEHSPDDEAIRVLASRYCVADLSESTLTLQIGQSLGVLVGHAGRREAHS